MATDRCLVLLALGVFACELDCSSAQVFCKGRSHTGGLDDDVVKATSFHKVGDSIHEIPSH